MPRFTDHHLSPYTPEQLYQLVADIERYPEFLPWCRAARILEKHKDYFLGELVIAFKGLSEKYTSKVSLHPPVGSHEGAAIEVEMVKGPFEYLINHWKFTPASEGGAEIDFLVDFKFRSRLLESLMGGLFTRASQKMSAAFLQRAETLYGPLHTS